MANMIKFLTVGVVSVLTATSSFANNINVESTVGTTAQEAAYVMSLAQDIDISQLAPNVDIDYIVMQKKHVRSGGASGEALVNITDQTCKINMPIGTDFSSSYLGTNEHHDFMKSVVTPENRNQEILRTEFAILHEAAHCNLYGTDKPFRADNRNVEELLNKYFRLSGASFLGKRGRISMKAFTVFYMKIMPMH